jgi:hypothetical protein
MDRQPGFRIYKTFRDREWGVLFMDGLNWAGFESPQQAGQCGKARSAELRESMADAVSQRCGEAYLYVEVGRIE